MLPEFLDALNARLIELQQVYLHQLVSADEDVDILRGKARAVSDMAILVADLRAEFVVEEDA